MMTETFRYPIYIVTKESLTDTRRSLNMTLQATLGVSVAMNANEGLKRRKESNKQESKPQNFPYIPEVNTQCLSCLVQLCNGFGNYIAAQRKQVTTF